MKLTPTIASVCQKTPCSSGDRAESGGFRLHGNPARSRPGGRRTRSPFPSPPPGPSRRGTSTRSTPCRNRGPPGRPPGRGEAAGRSGARHPDIHHRPGAPRRPASEPAAAAAAGDKKVRQGPGRLNRAIKVRDAPGKRRREWDDVQVWDFVRPAAPPDHAGHRDGQRLHPRSGGPFREAPSCPEARTAALGPPRRRGILEAGQGRGDVVPRPDVQPDPRDFGCRPPPPPPPPVTNTYLTSDRIHANRGPCISVSEFES